MNNTAYNSLKKLFLMSLVLFAGAAFGQSSNTTGYTGTQKPATTETVKKGSTAVSATTINSTAAPAKSKDSRGVKQAETVTPVSTKPATGSAQAKGTKADATQQIAKIDAKLASNDSRLTPAAKAKLQARRDALSKQLTK